MPNIDETPDDPSATWCPVVELRQYTLHAGRREDLIQLFEREFIESQEAVGATVLGQFRDLDHPDAFVWLRGFAGMHARAAALSSFYDGPVWQAHRDRANATLIDSDNVLLLRPARPGTGFAEVARPARATLDREERDGFLAMTIYYLEAAADVAFLEFFERELAPAVREAGPSIDAYYATEPSPNNFPRLPVREDGPVLAWFSRFPDSRGNRDSTGRSLPVDRLRPALRRRLASFLRAEPEVHRLLPTARSRLRSGAS